MNYYQAGDNYGRSGNYAYQAGGIWSSIAGGLVKVGRAVLGATPVGRAVNVAAAGLAGVGVGRSLVAGGGGPVPQLPVPSDYPGAIPKPGARGAIERFLPGGASGYILGKKKRMNVANVKALRRALRRQRGFIKLAQRALKGTGMTIRRSGGGGRGGSRGVITRSEAARALRG